MRQFQPLAKELGLESLLSPGGWHDMLRPVVTTKSLTSNIVAIHEGLHDRFLRETHFGWVQLILRDAFERTGIDSVRLKAAAWSEQLLACSVITHEVAATYLSVKQLPLRLHNQVIQDHPPEYRRYYNTLAAVIDPVCTSSYLQFMVGLTVVEFAFSSPIIERLSNWSVSRDVEIFDHEKPDVRLGQLLPAVSREISSFVESLAHETAASDIDIQSEGSWLKTPMEAAARVDDQLQLSSRAWMRRLCELINIDVISPEDWVTQRQAFRTAVRSEAGLGTSDGYNFLQKITLDKTKIGRMLRDAQWEVYNNQLPIGFYPRQHHYNGDPKALFTPEATERLLISPFRDNDTQERGWIWLAWSKGHENAAHMEWLTHYQAIDILKYRNAFAASTGFVPALNAVVAQVRMTQCDEQFMKEIARLHYVPGVGTFALNQLIWYLGGDFWQWYEWLTADGAGEFFFTYNERIKKALSESNAYQRFDIPLRVFDECTSAGELPEWVVVLNKRRPGVFARLFPAQAEGHIIVVNNHHDNGAIANSSAETKQVVGDVIIKLRPWLVALCKYL